MRIIAASLLLLFLALPSYASEQESLIFNTFLIPLMVESETEGVFIELTQEVARRARLDIKINILPAKRSINDFVRGKADALFPALNNFFPSPDSFSRSQEIIYIKRDFSFSLANREKLYTIKQLAGHKVSITRGYIYADELVKNTDIQFFTANSDEFAAKMLQAGHVDAFIAEEQSGLTALKNIGLINQVQYAKEQAISELDVFYATLAGSERKRLAERLSQQLTLMKQDGTFERIMAKAKAKRN
jgi:polar amino acid transport system substrate-binding protein